MTLTVKGGLYPSWLKREEGIESYKEFKLGERVKVFGVYFYIIHIQMLDGHPAFFAISSEERMLSFSYGVFEKVEEGLISKIKECLSYRMSFGHEKVVDIEETLKKLQCCI